MWCLGKERCGCPRSQGVSARSSKGLVGRSSRSCTAAGTNLFLVQFHVVPRLLLNRLQNGSSCIVTEPCTAHKGLGLASLSVRLEQVLGRRERRMSGEETSRCKNDWQRTSACGVWVCEGIFAVLFPLFICCVFFFLIHSLCFLSSHSSSSSYGGARHRRGRDSGILKFYLDWTALASWK